MVIYVGFACLLDHYRCGSLLWRRCTENETYDSFWTQQTHTITNQIRTPPSCYLPSLAGASPLKCTSYAL